MVKYGSNQGEECNEQECDVPDYIMVSRQEMSVKQMNTILNNLIEIEGDSRLIFDTEINGISIRLRRNNKRWYEKLVGVFTNTIYKYF